MPESNPLFDQLYREHFPRLYRLAYASLKDIKGHHLAEDIVEDTFVLYLCRQNSLADHPNLGGWLSEVTKNMVRDERKAARHHREAPLETEAHVTSYDTYYSSLDELLPKGLLPKEREILILRFEEQLSYAEISQHLGISVPHCRVRLSRAKEHYKVLIKKDK